MEKVKILANLIKFAFAGLLLFAILILVTPIGALFVIGGEDILTKAHIDNQYVDSGFRNWNEVEIPNARSIILPEGWRIQNRGSLYLITDSDNAVWAYGGPYGQGEQQFQSASMLVSAYHSNQPVTDYSVDLSWGTIAMEASGLLRVTMCLENSAKEYYELYLRDDSEGSLCFIILADLEQSEVDFDIAEAILFHFAYVR